MRHACLEYYWRQVARAGIDTGFAFDNVRAVRVLRSQRFLQDEPSLKLFKLHGSVNWKIEKETGEITEEDIPIGTSMTGRRFVGDVMLYPIAEKELYLDPYISMLLRLNRELERKSVWVVIGYSFSDPVVREIFLRKSKREKHLILLHPKAIEVRNRRLSGIKGKVSLMEKRFGLPEDKVIGGKRAENYQKVNHQIIHKLKEEPKFKWHDRVTP